MDHRSVGDYWNRNAPAWTKLARAGYDTYRDHLNSPAFFSMLPAITGLQGLDIGCGEGHNTRELARRGAIMRAIDISDVFLQFAQQSEREQPLGIDYIKASAVALPFADQQFDFATSFMCLMDFAEQEAALAEAYRVLKPGGFFQFSITHPCFDTPHRRNLRDPEGRTFAIEVGDYFGGKEGTVERWIFGATPAEIRAQVEEFQIPRFHRTISQWINQVIEAGFVIERCNEPCPSPETVAQHPTLQDAQIVAYFLHLRGRKASAN